MIVFNGGLSGVEPDTGGNGCPVANLQALEYCYTLCLISSCHQA